MPKKNTSRSRSDSVDSAELLDQMENDLELDFESSPNEISIPTVNMAAKQISQQNQRIDIWLKCRGSRKRITAIEGFDLYPEMFGEKKSIRNLLNYFKGSGCSGTLVKKNRIKKLKISFLNPTSTIITFQGDHVDEVKDYLMSVHYIDEKDIHLH